ARLWLYITESTSLLKSEVSKRTAAWHTAYYKVFNISSQNVARVELATGVLPLSYQFELKKFNFLKNCKCSINLTVKFLFDYFGKLELSLYTEKYGISIRDSSSKLKRVMLDHFSNTVSH